MATDVKESDTEDHEVPAPPIKRQCINVGNGQDEMVNMSYKWRYLQHDNVFQEVQGMLEKSITTC